jgi:hypothetical protein
VSEAKNKPVPDEQALAKLLEAAYVLQEHNREMRDLQSRIDSRGNAEETRGHHPAGRSVPAPGRSTAPVPSDNASTLAKIVETQHQIQVRRLDFESALKLVAERVSEMTKAAGVAIGIIEGNSVRYCAVAGYSTPTRDSIVTLHKSMLGPCLKTGTAFHCSDTSTEGLPDPDACKSRGIRSLIAVPVYHDGEVAGGLELYYSSPKAFEEQEVHTCQLMAGLVAEALVREEEANWKKSLATERAAMLEALEKLQPNLAALVDQPRTKNATAEPEPGAASYSCRKCGHQLKADEQFCGQCGSPRAGDYGVPNTHSKLASLWHMQESQKKGAGTGSVKHESPRANEKPEVGAELSLARSLEQQIPEFLNSDDLEVSGKNEAFDAQPPIIEQEITPVEGEDPVPAEATSDETPGSSQTLTKPSLMHPAVWGSAASARAFFEQLASSKRAGKLIQFWNRHRGDIYLGIAVILVLCVLRWGLWSNHSAKATASPAKTSATQHKAAQDAGLSFFDRMLIQLGLAEAPDAPPDRGNPGVQVWVDLHTALYYCPGSDLYGKTAKGKFTTQREAQLDQFEPAYRKVCN